MRSYATVTSKLCIMDVVLNWQNELIIVRHNYCRDFSERDSSFVTCTCSMSARRGI